MEKIMIEHSAELLAKKGDMAFMKDNGREARDCFVKAVELMPKVAEYQTGLARARQMR
jgi:Flp pilus assembly protein TadD